MRLLTFLFAVVLSPTLLVTAAEGDPLAIRRWQDDAISIETHWGLHFLVQTRGSEPSEKLTRFGQWVSLGDPLDHVMSRLPNTAETSWQRSSDGAIVDANQMSVRNFANDAIIVTVDGVSVVIAGSKAKFDAATDDIDVLVIDTSSSGVSDTVSQSISALHPRVVIPIGTDERIAAACESLSSMANVKRTKHNTLAISATDQPAAKLQVVALTTTPWAMPESLESLFTKMNDSCRRSQAVFAKLSTEQMNFKPANGTHTPRWNTEHMMGRQLLFFSQIYHEIDPAIAVMDLNPAQMPPDYVYAHADWDGGEEARQMQRVSDFCRRFAYLLDGIEPSEKAPGSQWKSLAALLQQMERHYDEHTANTVKKFDLPDWPQ